MLKRGRPSPASVGATAFPNLIHRRIQPTASLHFIAEARRTVDSPKENNRLAAACVESKLRVI